MKQYGYHVKATLSDGTVEEHDIIAPLLTVANARYIGGGLEVSPYSLLDDGMLDLVWLNCKPNVGQCAKALSNAYNGRLLASQIFSWKRVRQVEITRAHEGDEPPVLMADGEYVGHLPVTVTAQAKALRVLVDRPTIDVDESANVAAAAPSGQAPDACASNGDNRERHPEIAGLR